MLEKHASNRQAHASVLSPPPWPKRHLNREQREILDRFSPNCQRPREAVLDQHPLPFKAGPTPAACRAKLTPFATQYLGRQARKPPQKPPRWVERHQRRGRGEVSSRE